MMLAIILLYAVAVFVVFICGIFVFRREMVAYFRQDEENTYLALSVVMTFFFSGRPRTLL